MLSFHAQIQNLPLSVLMQDKILHIKISDNGSGIDAKDVPTIFDPFVTHKRSGTGLGLAIARRIITAHNGSIQVESILGKGSVFTIVLPI